MARKKAVVTRIPSVLPVSMKGSPVNKTKPCSALPSIAKALSTSLPEQLVGRQEQLNQINEFLDNSLTKQCPSCLYVSGAPGTGKSACLQKTMKLITSKNVKKIWINCMSLRNATDIFNHVLQSINPKQSKLPADEAKQELDTIFTTSKSMFVVVLDEIDYLEGKSQDILYGIIEWPVLTNSHVILIGVANALDLTDRLLPRLALYPGLKPQLLHFPPYSRDEIKAIITARIEDIAGSTDFISPAALQLLSGKVSAVAGDARKALAVCSRSMEVAEKRALRTNTVASVGPAVIADVLSEVYDHPVMGGGRLLDTLPVHQKLAVCAVLINMRGSKNKEVATNSLLATYLKVCRAHHAAPVGSSEFPGLLTMLETQGIVSVKKPTARLPGRLVLSLDEDEVKAALLDDPLLNIVINCSM